MNKNKLLIITSTIILIFLSITLKAGELHAQQPVPSPEIWSPQSTMVWYMSRGYGYNPKVITLIGSMIGNDDDVSVCLYIARQVNYDPQDIMGFKRSGCTWKYTIKSVGMAPEKLFLDIGTREITDVPKDFKYSFGEYKKWKDNPDYQMDLTDDSVRDLVQLHFIVRMFGITPVDVMKKHNSGKNWTELILSNGR